MRFKFYLHMAAVWAVSGLLFTLLAYVWFVRIMGDA